MNFYLKAPKWDSTKCKKEDPYAVPLTTKKLSNVTVIQVKNASYRLATIEGVFAVVNGRDIKVSKSGKHTKKVFCTWYGHQIQTDFPELTLDPNHTEVIENYTGKVVVDIGKDPKRSEAKAKPKTKAAAKKKTKAKKSK
jgi:hypothetical protein